MVLVQKWPFFQLFFFFCNLGQENVFYNILEWKTAFYGIKTGSSKIDIFAKRLTHGFGPKRAIFPTFFFLGNMGQENVFYDILERKNAFLGYKNNKFKKFKNWHFCKAVFFYPWFWSKNGHFWTFFFFSQFNPRKYLLRYSRTKKRLSRLLKQQV